MFESMSQNVQTILTETSRAIAFSLKHEHVHPEHIVMALFETPDCVAVQYLGKRFPIVKMGPEIAALVMAIPTGNPKSPDLIAFSDVSKKVIDQSLVEAKQVGSDMIGTEHLLMALVMNYEPLRKILKEKFDVTYGQIREALKPAPRAEGDLPEGPGDQKVVRVSNIMGAVFFDAKMAPKDIELALIVMEQIKGVQFARPMPVPPELMTEMGGESDIMPGRFKTPKPR
jgi:ATP-dependent Clp protease ATP-binding subunit ClpA